MGREPCCLAPSQLCLKRPAARASSPPPSRSTLREMSAEGAKSLRVVLRQTGRTTGHSSPPLPSPVLFPRGRRRRSSPSPSFGRARSVRSSITHPPAPMSRSASWWQSRSQRSRRRSRVAGSCRRTEWCRCWCRCCGGETERLCLIASMPSPSSCGRVGGRVRTLWREGGLNFASPSITTAPLPAPLPSTSSKASSSPPPPPQTWAIASARGTSGASQSS
mmetsp:Transcript_2157/g.4949  ORF Transcript_2157/g.4949 Transcript_2157/m.4949 type:complete len:220 (-) Transcript_2157:2786-3445(-)